MNEATCVQSFVGGPVHGSYGVGNPLSVDRKRRFNANVTNKTGPQSETTVAVNPTNPLDIIASSNDLTGADTFHAYESTDGGKHWSLVNTGVSGFCYDTWAHFNDVGDAFIAYECSDQDYAYRLHGSAAGQPYLFFKGDSDQDRPSLPWKPE